MTAVNIIPALLADLAQYYDYIARQLADNGSGKGPLFQPVSSSERSLPAASQAQFNVGLTRPLHDLSWRRLWLLKDSADDIRGHIDLRHHGDPNCLHRVRMGMGVERGYRGAGLGQRLLTTALDFCCAQPTIAWLDLSVLADNLPAQQLYLKHGFTIIGKTQDQYRIDGQSVDEIAMTKAVDG